MTVNTNFNQLTAKLEDLTKKEVERRSEWRYENFKRTVTFGSLDQGIYGTFVYPFRHIGIVKNLCESVSSIKINLFWYEFSKNKKGEHLKYEWHQYKGTEEQPTLFEHQGTQNGVISIDSEEDLKTAKMIVKEGRIAF